MIVIILISVVFLSLWLAITAQQRMSFFETLETTDSAREPVIEFSELSLGLYSVAHQMLLLQQAAHASLGVQESFAVFNDDGQWSVSGPKGQRHACGAAVAKPLSKVFEHAGSAHLLVAEELPQPQADALYECGCDVMLVLPRHAKAPWGVGFKFARPLSGLCREVLEETYSALLTALASLESTLNSRNVCTDFSGNTDTPVVNLFLGSPPVPDWLEVNTNATEGGLAVTHSGKWWATSKSGSQCLIIVGHASANGQAASLLVTAIRAYFDRLMSMRAAPMTAGQVASELNQFLFRPLHPVGMAATAIVVNRKTGAIETAGSGALVMTLDRAAEPHKVQQVKGPLIGVDTRSNFAGGVQSSLSKGGTALIASAIPGGAEKIAEPAGLKNLPGLSPAQMIESLNDTELGKHALLAIRLGG